MNESTAKDRGEYRIEQDGFLFLLGRDDVARLRQIAEFEGREEPAVAEDFLRAGAERWAETLSAARTTPSEIRVRVDAHQRKAHLARGGEVVVSADI